MSDELKKLADRIEENVVGIIRGAGEDISDTMKPLLKEGAKLTARVIKAELAGEDTEVARENLQAGLERLPTIGRVKLSKAFKMAALGALTDLSGGVLSILG